MAARDGKLSKVEQEVERSVLSTKVELSDGTSGNVFTRNPYRNDAHTFTYNCHICGIPNLPGERCLYTHISGRRHQTRLTQKPFNANLFNAPLQRSHRIAMDIAPGEPVPPGLENELKANAEIQAKVDKCKTTPFIGLEYLLELTLPDDKEPTYLCVLCEKRGDPRTIMDHLKSYKHRLKYLEKHFPTVTREIAVYRYNREARDVFPHIVQKICEAIEDSYGRLTPSVYDNDEYEKNRMSCLQEIINDKHFSEKSGSSFLHVIDKKEIDEWIAKSQSKLPAAKRSASPLESNAKRGRTSNSRRSLDSISSISSSSLDRSPVSRGRKKNSFGKDDDVIYIRSRSTSPQDAGSKSRSESNEYSSRRRSPSSRNKSPSRQTIPTPRELAIQANAISAEGYKWEKYRCLVEVAVKELEKQRLEHEKSPENHPLYPEEWKIFWNRRYKELQAEKKDPTKYDYTPEWKKFWTKRMRELHDESIEKKKDEIRKKLNLPMDARERTSELKEKFSIKVSNPSRKDDSEPSTSSRRDKSEKTHRYERSRSREKVLKSSDSYKRPAYDREKSDYESDRRDRHRRPGSRGSYHDDSPVRYVREERDQVEYYSHNPYKWHSNHPKSHYYSKSNYYGREMPAASIPKYEEQQEEEPEDDDSLTIVTVLRLLSALEELLGPSLGPKIVELLAKALALEKVKANSADEMLLNEDNCVLFETIKEKLKGQLMNDMVEKHQAKAVKRAIKNIASVIHLASQKEKNKTPEEKQQDALRKKNMESEKAASSATETKTKSPEEIKKEMAKKIAAALVAQGKTNVSAAELESIVNYYYKQRMEKENAAQVESASTSRATPSSEGKSASPSTHSIDLTEDANDTQRDQEEGFDLPQDASSALENLTDVDLQTLLQNFEDLSTEEQQHLHKYMMKLEASDPKRVEKLRKYVNVAFDMQKPDDRNKHNSVEHVQRQVIDNLSPQNQAQRVNDPYSDMFYDDTKDERPPVNNIVDSDDDDYSYDDLCKAASKNVKDKQREQRDNRNKAKSPMADGDSPKHDQFILSDERNCDDASRASGENSNSNSRNTLNDTESIIDKLMGSLHKNVQSRIFPERNQVDESQLHRQQIQSNVPFYLQQAQNSYAPSNSKVPNEVYTNDFNLGTSQQFASSNQYANAYPNANYGNAQQRLNIPLNIPSYAQQQQQQQHIQATQLANQLFAQLNQQNRRW